MNSNDKKIFPLYARVLYKEGKYIESRKYFEQFAKENDPYSMYKYGKMLFCGYSWNLNVEEAIHYLNLSKENGFRKSELNLIIESLKKEIELLKAELDKKSSENIFSILSVVNMTA